jgi:hypothetical protein
MLSALHIRQTDGIIAGLGRSLSDDPDAALHNTLVPLSIHPCGILLQTILIVGGRCHEFAGSR